MEINENYYGFIYKTTCLINGKIYIGQHKIRKNILISKRYLGSGDLIYKAIKKYGRKNFEREILKYCDNQEKLDLFELIYIKKFKSIDLNIGYNILPGCLLTFKLISEEKKIEIRKKISDKMKEYWKNNPKRKIELSKRRTGIKESEETKRLQSEKRKGVKFSDSHKNKISIANGGINHWAFGTTFSEEHRANLSKNIKGKMVGKNHPHYGKTISEEHKKAISAANLKRWIKKKKQNE